MKEIVLILYNYFQLFLLVPLIMLVCIARTKKMEKAGSLRTTVLLWVVFIVAFIPAIGISRTGIFHDEMTVWLEEEGQATINTIDFGAGITSKNMVLGHEPIHIKIPYGAERKIYITSSGSCRVNMQMERYGYRDSYAMLGENAENILTIYTDTPGIKLVFELFVKIFLVILITSLLFEVIYRILGTLLILRANVYSGGGLYELVIFVYMSVLLLLQNPYKINDWMPAWYVLSYKDGMGSRLLVGTLVNIFCGNYVTHKEALTFILAAMLILAGSIIRKSGTDRNAVIFFVAVYLAAPGNIAYFGKNVGRLEMFSLIFFLIGIILFEKSKNDHIKYFFLFLFSEFALAVHQGTIFYYYPMIVTVLMYELCTRFSFRKMVLTIVNFIGVFVTFVYFQLYSGLRFGTLEEAMGAIGSRTDMEIDQHTVRLEYFASLKENFEYGQAYFLKHYNYERMVLLAVILLVPLLIFLTGILKLYLKEQRGCTEKHILCRDPVFFILLSYLLYIPIYGIMCDWGRWTGALMGTSFFNIGYLYGKGDGAMRKVFVKLEWWVGKNKFICIIVLLYLAGLDKFYAIFPPMLYNLYHFIFGG